MSSGIVRVSKRDSGYMIVDPYFLSDGRLSWKAKGLLSYLLSKPSNWRVYVSDLVKRSKDGKDAVYSALRELEGSGYVERTRIRDEETQRITGVETVVYERPITIDEPADIPQTEIPDVEKSDRENPPQVINDLSNYDSKKKEVESAEEILQTLSQTLRKIPLNDTATLYDHHFEDIYAMLSRRVGDDIRCSTIRAAGERYFFRVVDLQTGLPNPGLYSPIGMFYEAYKEAEAERRAREFREGKPY